MDALVLVLNSTASPASGCTDRTATNFAPEASVDDGSCEWMGGRGALLQSWRTYAAKVSRVISDADSAVVMRFWRLGMLGSQRLAKKKGPSLLLSPQHGSHSTAKKRVWMNKGIPTVGQ